jgi:hypothetical protein
VFRLLTLLFLFPLSSFSAPANYYSTNDSLLRAFAFLESEGDQQNLQALSSLVLDKHYSDYKLLEEALDYFVKLKDRKRLFDVIFMLAVKNSCLKKTSPLSKKSGGVCEWLKVMWTDGLWQLPFYDATAAVLFEARDDVRSGQCDKAQAKLYDLERKEGPLRPLLETLEETYRCLGNADRLQYTQIRIESLRIFDL